MGTSTGTIMGTSTGTIVGTSTSDGGSTGTASESTGASGPQTLFEESFVDGTFPAGWSRYNLDGRVPSASVAYVTDAWVSHDLINALVPGQGFAATSTSWYAPPGPSDDWMVTPAIAGITADTLLQFNAMAPDASYADGFELWITEAGSTVDDFLVDGTKLLDVAAEPSTLTPHQIDLGAFAGSTIHLAWRNDSSDKFLLWIDDIVVVDQ